MQKRKAIIFNEQFQLRIQMVKYFYQKFPRFSIAIFFGLLISGILEAVGILSMLPLLDVVLNQNSSSKISKMINDFIVGLSFEITPILLILVISIAFFMKAFVHVIILRLISVATAEISFIQRQEYIQLILGAAWQFFTTQSTGHLVNTSLYESSKASACFIAICRILENFVKVGLLLVAASLVSWQVAALAIAVGLIISSVLRSMVALSARTGADSAEASRSLSKVLTDAVQCIKPLKAMNQEGNLSGILESHSQTLRSANSQQLFAKTALPVIREPLIVVILLIGILLMHSVGQGFSGIVVLAALFYRAVTSWGLTQQHLQTLAVNEAYFWSYYDAMERLEGLQEVQSGRINPKFEDKIELKGVSLTHNGKAVLANVNLVIRQNMMTALIGVSGSGKTSIADIVCSLHQVSEGEVLIDGIVLTDLAVKKWREKIGYVSQEVVLFNSSILENITLSDPSISDAEVWKVIQDVEMFDFVTTLPDGLNTVVGERGYLLSGGQRQRLNLARALVRNPRLLILDEATSALDQDTERKILTTLKKISRRLAVLIITHQSQISTVADVVYELGALRNTDTCSQVKIHSANT